jgi:polysaccharide deacetylase 2 family uncharacterized protein YibQ
VAARPRRRRRAAPRLRLRRWLRRQDRFTRGLLYAVIALSVLVVALIAPRFNDQPPRPTAGSAATVEHARQRTPRPPQQLQPRQPAPAQTAAARPEPSRAVRPPLAPPTRAARELPRAPRVAAERPAGPRLAIVIDDLGQSLSHFEQLADLDLPLTIAVIPGLPASERTVREAGRRGVELLLHQPMEPLEERENNPGEGVLLTTMTPEALRAQVRASLAAVPGAVGVNNHMGSRFTTDLAGLGAVMAEIKEHGLFWLDSRTIPSSRGAQVARAAGVPALERDIFIDAEIAPEQIRRQVRRLVEIARVHGAAIGIGHPHPQTIATLREMRAELLASGVALVPLSALLRTTPQGLPVAALAAAAPAKGTASLSAGGRKAPTP